MARLCILIVLLVLYTGGCAHNPGKTQLSPPEPVKAASPPLVLLASSVNVAPSKSSDAFSEEFEEDYDDIDYADDKLSEEKAEIADPIEPFNRAMFQINDKLYFWVLKPVAQGYKSVVPEPARVGVKNFFSNLGFPGRFLSCLLQADIKGAATELGRFTVNTLWGMGGLLDPSAGKEINLVRQEADLGQTLGVYGLGHGFYIVWPVFGPSSPRDSINIAGNTYLHPIGYIDPWSARIGARSFEVINRTSLSIGEYESLKGAAIDPYVSMRDAYVQYRLKQVKARKQKSLLFKAQETGSSDVEHSAARKLTGQKGE